MSRTRCCMLMLLLLTAVSLAQAQGHRYTNRELFVRLIDVNDGVIRRELGRQLTERGKRYEGALFDDDSVVSPIRTAQFIQTLMCGYVSKQSKYFQSKEILARMMLAANALVGLQHEDGTIDLLTTNFHSTPDLGFTIFPLAISWSIMSRNKGFDYGELSPPLRQYLVKAGDALSVGGIHTPNHRWVVSAALAWLYEFFGEAKYKTRIDQWLAEKVDIDPDGQYNERSTSVYTPVTNRCLIDIAGKLKYHHLYDVVGKNLELTFYFVHANGEIATESSRRQDKYVRSNMSKYYQAYNHLALRSNDRRFSGMLAYIQETVPPENLHYMLPLFIEDPALLKDLPKPEPIPTRYHKHFSYSDMVRIREDEVDMSVITSNPTFFTFFKGDAALEAVRLSSAFFGKGQFVSERMEKDGDTYVLTSTINGPYYQPLPKEKIPSDTDAWTKVPRTEREQSEIQTLRTSVFVTPRNGKATIRVVVDGPENLPVTLELGFRAGGVLQNADRKSGVDSAWLGKDGEYAIYRNGADVIKVGPGVRAHKWTELRGALPKLQADCLYFTNYAPCEFEFTVE